MSAKARAEYDFAREMVVVHVGETDHQDRLATTFSWGDVTGRVVDPAMRARDDDGLHIPERLARAVYEALADHFGHTTHDVRALRRDYDAERARVDKFLNHMLGGA